MNQFVCLCHREILVKIRQPRDMVFALLFFVMTCLFFPLSLPITTITLQQLAPGIVWFSLTLTMLLSLDQLWQQDYDNGLMVQWYLMEFSFVQIVQAKILVHWVITLISLLCFLPLLAIGYGLSIYQTLIFSIALSFGSLIIAYLTSLAAVFSLSMQQKGVLVAFILLPLVLPVNILGSGIIDVVSQNLNVKPYLALLMAASITSTMIFPWVIAFVLRMQISECEIG